MDDERIPSHQLSPPIFLMVVVELQESNYRQTPPVCLNGMLVTGEIGNKT
jgi:hypothetical protein